MAFQGSSSYTCFSAWFRLGNPDVRALGKPFPQQRPITRRLSAWTIWLAFLVITSLPTHADPVPSLLVPRITHPPTLADYLEGRPREAEMIVTNFHQMDPSDGAQPTQQTTAYLSYDTKNLYVGFICKDDPEKIRARVAKRKDIASDDRVSLNVDTFHDGKHAYWFDVNPYGVQFDGRTTDGVGDDATFETLWYSAGQITPDGYVVLITVPFRSLRFPQGEKQVWGVGLFRFIMRNNEVDAWPALTHKRDPQWVGQFGEMTLPSGTSPGRNIQIIPYGLYSFDKYLDPVLGNQINNGVRAGVDAKMVIKDSYTFDLTFNPDFSQIESDAPQVTVNQRYLVVYPEKRPFFMENSSVFHTPQTLFFSRNIADPQFGAKLTGSRGQWSVGAIVADDRAPGQTVAIDDPQYGDRAIDGVGRVERQFGPHSHAGAFASGYKFGSAYNWVGSLDTRMLLKNNWYLGGQAGTSKTQYEDGTGSAGPVYSASLRNSNRNWHAGSYFTDTSPGFVATLGYIPRVDLREWDNNFGYQWHQEGGTINSFGPGVTETVDWDHNGVLQDWIVRPNFSITLARQTYAQFTHSETYEYYENIGFRKHRNDVFITSDLFKWLSLTGDFNSGLGVNYYPPDGVDPTLGHSTNAFLDVVVRPNPRIKLDESYIYARLGRLGDLPDETFPASFFNNHILRSNANFQFSRELSFSAIMDYNAVLPNTDYVAADYSKVADTTLLLTYFRNPGTAFYLGYSTTFENSIWGTNPTPGLYPTQYPGTQADRQIFAKISYLLRF